MRRGRGYAVSLALLSALAVLFVLLFYKDNKYMAPPPYGRDGVITLQEENFAENRPIFLIDGWLLSDAHAHNQPTWIGEFANLKRGGLSISPHGQASYTLALRYTGDPVMAAVDFGELFSDYTITLNGRILAKGRGNAQITFWLAGGDQILKVETSSRLGYYSGMYYPPALGTPDTLAALRNIRSFAYALAFLVPSALALFTLLLWRTGGVTARWFALLCCFFALYVSWYFVQLFHLPIASCWFFVENAALYGLCFCAVRLTALASGSEHDGKFRQTSVVMVAFPAILMVMCLLIPVFPWAVSFHGILTDFYYIVTFFCMARFALRGVTGGCLEERFTLSGCWVFGAGLVCNLIFSNHFEPIYFFWQFEWCGLLLVGLFGVMMAARNRRILLENTELTEHLEHLVEQRTAELRHVLEERKAFFSDMAHDLKAPVFATQSFLTAIRSDTTGTDSERYLALAERKQQEMARRLQGLSSLNALDKIDDPREQISVRRLLREVHDTYRGEADVASIHFILEEPDTDGYIFAQVQKLELLFENLIYNALRATPPGGRITVSASFTGMIVTITVADTGCGIAPEELPLIFRRFYVGTQNRDSGTGLGLYIVQTILEELGGTVRVSSRPGTGTAFVMEIPLIAESTPPQ